MSTAGSHTLTARERLEPHRWVFFGVVTLLAIYCWLFWDFLARQVEWAFRHPADWGHTLVIPLIAAWFVWLHRRELLARPFRTTWVGLVPVVLGIVWYSVCSLVEAARNHNLQGLGVWMTLFGLVLLFCGFRAMRYLWFPLVYVLVFGQSISNRAMNVITLEMQDIAARGAHVVLMLLGADVDRQGNTLFLFKPDGTRMPINIAEACSGMRMLMAFMALGVAMAYTGFSRFWQRTALIVLAVPVALAVNILRVVTLTWLARYDTDLAAGDFHTFVGLVWLVPALLIYLGLIWIIRHAVIEPEDAATAP